MGWISVKDRMLESGEKVIAILQSITFLRQPQRRIEL